MRILVTFAIGLGLGWYCAPRHAPRANPDSAERPFATLLEALEHAAGPAPAGARTLSGRVLDDDGNALAGVEVTATPVPEEQAEDLLGQVRHHARERIWRRDGTRAATTAKDGSYLIEGLGDANYRLRARRRGYRFSTASRNWRGVLAPDVVDWRAHAIVRLELIVVRPDGTKPDEATIVCLQENERFQVEWTPQRPHVALDVGIFWIRATSGEWQSEAVEFRGRRSSLTLVLGRKR